MLSRIKVLNTKKHFIRKRNPYIYNLRLSYTYSHKFILHYVSPIQILYICYIKSNHLFKIFFWVIKQIGKLYLYLYEPLVCTLERNFAMHVNEDHTKDTEYIL